MNTRIKELVEKASGEFYTGFAGSPNSIKFMENDFEKFAELIVKECAELIDSMDHSSQYFPHVADAIKEHFGVEE